MISVYKQEVLDGVAEQVKATASIKYVGQVKAWNEKRLLPVNLDIKDVPELARASIADDWDLYPFASVLVSVGWNDNDDVFDAGEAYSAKNSPVNKQLNFMHDEKSIIGHMTKAIVMDADGNIIEDDGVIPDFYDIVVANVIYRRWSDEELQDRIDKIIAGIPENKWFVSMECLFRGFDYALISPDGEESYIRRDASTAYLTKYLRAYGGNGYYQENKIGRMIRHLTFSGNAIVDNPANPRSIIFNKTDPFKGTANKVDFPKQEKENMADNTDVVVSQLKEELAKTTARYEKLEEKFQAQVEEAQKAEQDRLEKQIAGLNVDVEDLQKKLDETKAALSAKETEFVELNKTHKDVVAKSEEMTKQLEKAESEKVKADRISKLVDANVARTEAESLVAKFENLNDEQFDEIVAMNKKAKAKGGTEDSEDEDSKAAADALDNAGADDQKFSPDDNEDTQAELSKAMCDWFNDVRNNNKDN